MTGRERKGGREEERRGGRKGGEGGREGGKESLVCYSHLLSVDIF